MAPKVQVKADEAKAKSVHQKCRYLIGIYMDNVEKFREWARQGKYRLEKDKDGYYTSTHTQSA